jgi:hypothetical protein
MGRREIWSDPQIQKMTSEFVCVIEETFFLNPPPSVGQVPDPAATRLFRTYVGKAPYDLFPLKTTTYQGLYCLTDDGGYLSGKFARQSREEAREVLETGLKNWRQEIAGVNGEVKEVPKNRLAMYGGAELRKGGLKLEVAYRDLPRGDTRRPGNAQFPNPYNMGWFDLSPREASTLATGEEGWKAIPSDLFRRLALTTLKDAVRGQMQDWRKEDLQSGELRVALVGRSGDEERYEIKGEAMLKRGPLSFSPTFHGRFSFDRARGEFTAFQMVAFGQRTGRGPANGRATDLGPAPMGIALTLYRP